MKKLLILFFLFGIIAPASFGQEFIKAYGNTGYDYGRDIKQDNDSGYVITGSSSSFGPDNGEAYLLKLDKFGDFEWSYNYGGEGADWGETVLVTNDSTYAVGGYTNSEGAGGFDFYLVRIGENGTPIWERTYGGSDWDRAYGMVQLADSGFVMAGESYSFNGGLRHGYMIRTDKNGDIVWEMSMTGDMESFLTDIALDGDSFVVCGGMGDGGDGTFDGYTAKYTIDGTLEWEKQVGQEYNDYFNSVFSVAGTYSYGGARGYNFPDEQENMWMYRLTDAGDDMFDTVYVNESLDRDIVHDVAVRDFDLDYYYIGESESYGYLLDGKSDIFVGKMTASELHFAQRNYGEKGADVGRAIERTRDNAVVFLCDTKFFSSGGHNILVVKLNSAWEYPDLIDELIYDDITSGVSNYYEDAEILNVYPNPTSGVVTIPSFNDGRYTVHSLDGKELMNEALVGNQIDFSRVKNGTYILTVIADGIIYQQRVIKNGSL